MIGYLVTIDVNTKYDIGIRECVRFVFLSQAMESKFVCALLSSLFNPAIIDTLMLVFKWSMG